MESDHVTLDRFAAWFTLDQKGHAIQRLTAVFTLAELEGSGRIRTGPITLSLGLNGQQDV